MVKELGVRSRRGPTRRRLQGATDAVCVATATLLAVALRYDLNWSRVFVYETVFLACVLGLAVVGVAAALGLYRGRWRFGSFEELGHLTLALFIAVAAVAVLEALVPALRSYVPLGALALCAGFSLIAIAGVRYAWRLAQERRLVRAGAGGRRVLVAGAGDAGGQIARALRDHPEAGKRPVAFLDDDPAKRHLILHGVAVRGRLAQLADVTAITGAQELLIAMPSADAELVARLTEQGEALGLAVTVLPSALELIGRGGQVTVGDIRRVSIVDLLGREPVQRDLELTAGYVRDRRVLVTGAGGSIGAELCRQLQRLQPRQILLYDHDETNLHGLQLELQGQALLDVPELLMGDIRDRTRLDAVINRHRPEVVFHAAAHKHLPLLEMHPSEAVKTNVLGTLNVARAAAAYGCTHFINVSTDKAAMPTSVLGATKRVAELACQREGQRGHATVFSSVRFGNVLGSRGSVVPIFERQIADGGPVTVTHPDATRFFMTVPEAAQLVIMAGALAHGGEVFVLDMGEPVRIADLATEMIRLAGAAGRVKLAFTGLRPGEKLHETLFFEDELARVAVQEADKILACRARPLTDVFDGLLEDLLDAALTEDDDKVLALLPDLVPGYRRPLDTPLLGDLYPDGL